MSFIPVDQLRSSSSDSSTAISSSRRLPPWFKVQAKTGPDYLDIKQTMDQLKLHTICEEARCPNRWECWNCTHRDVPHPRRHLHQAVPLLFSRDRQTSGGRS